MPALLEMRDIRKRFPGVIALDAVCLELNAGEVHCLVGENGAGKSTLMKILSGALIKDGGEILVDGHAVEVRTPSDAFRFGIGIIYQDFKLVPELTVAENIMLGSEPTRGMVPFLKTQAMHDAARNVLAMLYESIDTYTPVRLLSVARQQIVEIAKALRRNVRVLVLDEPSASLTDVELKNLFGVIRKLKSQGVGIIYISHRLDEIFEIGDRVTVIRDGKVVTTCNIVETDRRSLIRWMVGRELENEYPKTQLQRGDEVLRVEGLSAGILKDIHLTLHKGEILGLAGLVGAGRSELARVIFGADPKERGKIILEGVEVAPRFPREAIEHGIGLLTEDRNRYGLLMQMTIRENISIANLSDLLRGIFIDLKKERAVAGKFADELRIGTPNLEKAVENLSGGNRQKVVLARWLYTHSKVLIFDEPTAGIDVGTKYEIYQMMNNLAAEGKGLIVISSDLPELLGLCDRIAVLCEGRITGTLSREQATQERVLSLSLAHSREAEHAA